MSSILMITLFFKAKKKCKEKFDTDHSQGSKNKKSNLNYQLGHSHKMFRFPSTDRPTHFFGKVKKKKYFNLQAHDLVLLTPIVLNYHRYFVFVAFLDIW